MSKNEPSHGPFVSVVMNCYNSARYLREALDSVRAQTFTDWEIVFWDNRSTDGSAEIFKSFDDTRFRYFLAPEHTFLGPAKNLAVENARGDWLAFIDCDDLWLPDKLERQIAIICAENNKLGLVYGRVEAFFENEILLKTVRHRTINGSSGGHVWLPEGNIFSILLQDCFISQPSVMIRRCDYLTVGGVNPDLKHAWDYDLWLKITKCFDAKAVQEICGKYRIHSSNLSLTHGALIHIEPLAIVQSYLPDQAALLALKKRYTDYALYLLTKMKFRKCLTTLFYHGDIRLFFKFLISKLFSRLERSFKI